MAKVRQVVKIRKKKAPAGTKVCSTCKGTGRVKA